MAFADVDEQTQSLSQSIINSKENSLNEVVMPTYTPFSSSLCCSTGQTEAQLQSPRIRWKRWPSNIYRRGSQNYS